jgi:aryl-alcohol dehydrogenase-like predicted oxidoreductase
MRMTQVSSLPLIAGRASTTGTRRYSARFLPGVAPDFYRPLAAGPSISSIGIGTYLGGCDDPDDARYGRAIREALRRGINLVDSAINYRCQRSERVIGLALREAIAAGEVTRDEVVICTKGGYIPLDGTSPATKADYKEYVRTEFIEPGIIDPSELVADGHCLAPAYIEHQIARSRENLGVRTIDLYYVHNPEQQLEAVSEDELRVRLRRLFRALEARVEAGDIARYGCATWQGLRALPGSRGHLSLADLVSIARDAGGEGHHFSAVQLPINLAMPEAVRTPTQVLVDGRQLSVLEAAAALGTAVIASATLLQSKLTSGLPAPIREAFPRLTTDAARAIAFVRTLPGVTAALVGMKSLAHLDQNLQAAL